MRFFDSKAHTSLKRVREVADAYGYPVFSCGYCALQRTLARVTPENHNSGTYGWNWDAYLIRGSDGRGVVIVSGYRNLGPKSMSAPHMLIVDTETMAENIMSNYYEGLITWKELESSRDELVAELADGLLTINDNRMALDTI